MVSELTLNNIDIANFIKTVESCKGNVFLETEDGDSLNLKSRLLLLAALAKLMNGGTVHNTKIRCELPEDETKLFRFDLYGELPN